MPVPGQTSSQSKYVLGEREAGKNRKISSKGMCVPGIPALGLLKTVFEKHNKLLVAVFQRYSSSSLFASCRTFRTTSFKSPRMRTPAEKVCPPPPSISAKGNTGVPFSPRKLIRTTPG